MWRGSTKHNPYSCGSRSGEQHYCYRLAMVGPIFASALSYNVYLHFRYLLPLFLIQDGIRCSRMKDERTDVLSFSIEIEAMDVFTFVYYRKPTAFAMLSDRMWK